jgi:hypothetical protein
MTSASKYKTGGEIDSYCTKCRLDLGHRIVAMVEGVPKRVLCLTCNSEHNYRKPKSAAAAEKAPAAAKAGGGASPSTRPGAPRSTASARAVAAAEAELARERAWEKAVSGQPVTSFKPYRVSASFQENDLIRHTKFGDGLVTRVLDKSKIEVMFREGPRVLAQGLVQV